MVLQKVITVRDYDSGLETSCGKMLKFVINRNNGSRVKIFPCEAVLWSDKHPSPNNDFPINLLTIL